MCGWTGKKNLATHQLARLGVKGLSPDPRALFSKHALIHENNFKRKISLVPAQYQQISWTSSSACDHIMRPGPEAPKTPSHL